MHRAGVSVRLHFNATTNANGSPQKRERHMAIFSRKQGATKAKAPADANRSDAGSSSGAPEKKTFAQRKPASG